MTNGERLRQMTDEELGKWLCKIFFTCGTCYAKEYCHYEHNGFTDWLKQESEDTE